MTVTPERATTSVYLPHELSSLVTNAVAKATETIYASRHHSDTAVVRIRLPLGAEGVDTDARQERS